MALRDVRDGAILVEFPGLSEEDANRAAIGLARRTSTAAGPGFRDAVPAARTLLVLFDSRRLSRDRIAEALLRGGPPMDEERRASRLVRIPVAYGGEAGADLAALARSAGLSEAEFARRHALPEYRVAFLGFAPGFAYLRGLSDELRAARLPTPRPRVAAGAVAIGGPWTGVYPAAMPGGWRLIGRSSARLFDGAASPPALLVPGDRVRFEPVAAGDLPSVAPPAPHAPLNEGHPVFRVIAPGMFATIQGAPRHGLGASGVPPGGAMDLRSLTLANAFVGNEADDPALEAVLAGLELEVLEGTAVAIAGAACAVELDGKPAPSGEAFRVPAGRRLRLLAPRGGARVYLAVEGGFLDTSLPGEPSRRLEAGTVLAARPVPAARRPTAEPMPSAHAGAGLVRVIVGPQADHFEAAERDRFLGIAWRVSPVSDRRGLRLEGGTIAHVRPPEIPPEGTVPGSIQVPGDGRPIVLGPDGPVTGGYPKIATVIEADLPLLGRAAPGDPIRFQSVTLDQADAARREYD